MACFRVDLILITKNPSGINLTRNSEVLTITSKLLSTMLVTDYPDQQTKGRLMNVQVRCNFCAHNFLVAQQWVGKPVSCPGCRRSIAVGRTPQTGRQTAQGDPRKRQFAKWWILLGLWVAAGLLLPTLAATIRQGISRGFITGLGLAVFASPLILFYGIGMIGYAGTLFEWRIYTKSRKTRRGIKWYGESRYHKMQLFMWGFCMISISTIAFVGTLVCSVALLFISGDQTKAARKQSVSSSISNARNESQAAEEKTKLSAVTTPERTASSFDKLDRMRDTLEANARSLQLYYDNILKLHEIIQRDSDALSARNSIQVDLKHFNGSETGRGHRSRYDSLVNTYKNLLEELESKDLGAQYQERITARHTEELPSFTFSKEVMRHVNFPMTKVYTAISEYKSVARRSERLVLLNDFDPSKIEPTMKKIEELEQFFEELRETHGFQPDISQEALLVKRFRQRLSEQKY